MRSCAGSAVWCRLTHGNSPEHADSTAPTRQHDELQYIKRADHDSICPERSRSWTVVGKDHTDHTGYPAEGNEGTKNVNLIVLFGVDKYIPKFNYCSTCFLSIAHTWPHFNHTSISYKLVYQVLIIYYGVVLRLSRLLLASNNPQQYPKNSNISRANTLGNSAFFHLNRPNDMENTTPH